MIDPVLHPVPWSQLMWELGDAHEHLGDLIAALTRGGAQPDAEFAVHLGHVYAHLNRAWHLRSKLDEITDEQRSRFSDFPSDLDPVG